MGFRAGRRRMSAIGAKRTCQVGQSVLFCSIFAGVIDITFAQGAGSTGALGGSISTARHHDKRLLTRTTNGVAMNFAAKVSVALLAMTAFAYAADDPYASFYSNTAVFTYPDQTVAKVFANKDGTWTSTSTDPKNPTGSGKWAVLGGWLCSTSAATPKAKPWCRKSGPHKMGDTWTDQVSNKTVAQVTLTAGR